MNSSSATGTSRGGTCERWYIATAWSSPPAASAAPVRAPAEVPTIRSASPRSTPSSRRAWMIPSIHAPPAVPPPDRTSALVLPDMR
jgi:hypothetical protein